MKDFFLKTLNTIYNDYEKPLCIGLYIEDKTMTLYFNLDKPFERDITNCLSMEHKSNLVYSSGNEINISEVWQNFRAIAKDIELPTTFFEHKSTKLKRLIVSNEVEILGRWVVKTFRDKVFKEHIAKKNDLFSDFNDEQLTKIDEHILGLLDSNAFNFGVFIDEKICFDDSIQITINNRSCQEINSELIGNGNFSGEYFDWISRFSEFGEL